MSALRGQQIPGNRPPLTAAPSNGPAPGAKAAPSVGERAKSIREGLASGKSYSQIAKELGISKQRAHQITKAADEKEAAPASSAEQVKAEGLNHLLSKMESMDPAVVRAELPRMKADYDKDVGKKASARHKASEQADAEIEKLVKEASSGVPTPDRMSEIFGRINQLHQVIQRASS